MPSPRHSKIQRKEFLAKLSAGHDQGSAAAALGLGEGQIKAGGSKLQVEIATAFRTGTSRLRAKIMETALSDDNSAVLMKLLEQRTAIQEFENGGITRIERVIFNGRCHHCGRLQTNSTDLGEKELARRLAFVIANGSQSIEELPESTRQDLNQ